ncbi:MAG TPA: lactonase family protein [Pirellulales bacterium]|jgi:6-phosphogluconolactonase|nr:lactonase family protein [Pirellulales bacterium]
MIRTLTFGLTIAFGMAFSHSSWAAEENAGKVRVYVGSYADAKNDGVHLLELDLASGKLTRISGASGIQNPSFLAIHPNKKFLYAVCEIGEFDGKQTGAVAGFAIEKDGGLKPLNRESSGGQGPCHLVVDKAGKNVLAANYGGGSVCCLPIGGDGRLAKSSAFIQHQGKSVDPGRQEGPHAHSVNLDPANHFAFVADLGLDQVMVYRFDADKGALKPNSPPFASVKPGSGPRHFAFHPSGRFAYVINEMALTVTAFTYDDAKGVLTEVQTISTVPDDFVDKGGNSTAEVQVHPSGKFVYGSNRGHNTIAAFSVDSKSGRLTPVGHASSGGKTPRNFGIDPSGKYLLAANQDSDNILVLAIDPETGKLNSTGHEIKVPKPVCVKFVTP